MTEGSSSRLSHFSWAALNAISAQLLVIDEHGIIVWTNQSWQSFVNDNALTLPDEAHYRAFAARSGQDVSVDEAAIAEGIDAVLSGRLPEFTHEYRYDLPSGLRWLRLIVKPLEFDGVRGALIMQQDITHRKEAESSLQVFKTAVEAAGEMILIADAAGSIEYANPAFAHATGYETSEMIGRHITALRADIAGPSPQAEIWDALRSGRIWQEEVARQRKNGSVYWEEQTIAPVFDGSGQLVRLVAVRHDITERKTFEERLKQYAFYDALTGLPNRVLFMDRAQQALWRLQRREQRLAILYLDLDGFKQINDRLGHRAGDQFLAETAIRIKNSLRTSDTAARPGGDEFIVLLEDVGQDSDVMLVANRIIQEATQPVVLAQHEVISSVSVGIAISDQGESDLETLLRNADIALYQAKARGKSQYVVYEADMRMPERILNESVRSPIIRPVDPQSSEPDTLN